MHEVKGVLGIIGTGITATLSIMEQIHLQLQIVSLAATVVLALITARYYWNKTKYYKNNHDKKDV